MSRFTAFAEKSFFLRNLKYGQILYRHWNYYFKFLQKDLDSTDCFMRVLERLDF